LPAGHGWNEHPFGVLTNIPLVWLALVVPRLWSRGRSVETRSILGGFLATIATLFGIGALTLDLFYWTAGRYEMEFLPALVLLAVIGMLSLERALSERPAWRCAVRWGWSLLLAFSVAFNLLASVAQIAEAHNNFGVFLMSEGKREEAIGQYEQAVHLNPDYGPAHNNLGIALERAGRMQEAIQHFEEALRIEPGYAKAHSNLAGALLRLGRVTEAVSHWEQAVEISPEFAEAYYNLGVALEKLGRTQEAIQQYEEAVRIRPDFVQARNALARAQARAGEGR